LQKIKYAFHKIIIID